MQNSVGTPYISATTPSSPSGNGETATSSVIFSNYGFDEEPLTLGDLLTWAIDTARQGCQMAKFDPFLSLECAMVEGVGVQSKERKGSNFAA